MTSWLRVHYHGDQPPWVTRDLPGRGLAAFATRRFRAGDWICTERPTTWVSGHHPFDLQQLAQIDERVAALEHQEKEAFCAMANAFPDAATPAAGIFMTNCFDMSNAAHGQSCAMCVSRSLSLSLPLPRTLSDSGCVLFVCVSSRLFFGAIFVSVCFPHLF